MRSLSSSTSSNIWSRPAMSHLPTCPLASLLLPAEVAAAAAASPAPALFIVVESSLPAKVRKLVTNSATGQQRYE